MIIFQDLWIVVWMQAVLPFAFINIYVGTLNQLTDLGIDKVKRLFQLIIHFNYVLCIVHN